MRCFTASKEVYQDSRWVHIQDYVQAHLAKHLTQLGRYSMALTCYLDIVSAGRQSPDRQGRFIREFLDLCVARPEGLLEVAKALEGKVSCDRMVLCTMFFISVRTPPITNHKIQRARHLRMVAWGV